MAGSLTREWHKGNRRVEEVAFLAPRALTVPTGLKIGGDSTFSSANLSLPSVNVTSHDSGTYICRLENGLGEGLEVQTVLEVREERPATVVHAPPNVVLVQGRSGKVLYFRKLLPNLGLNVELTHERERCLPYIYAQSIISREPLFHLRMETYL